MTTAESLRRASTPGSAERREVLVLEGLMKQFGATMAVDAVDLRIDRGELLTLLGPSGSGKTTILRLVAGFEIPTSGRILLDGRDVSRLPPAARGIGMVLQHYALFPHMTVADNIAYGLKLRRWPGKRRRQRVDEMLALVRLPGIGSRSPRELSGGQQQRVALARALAFDPKLLLMDEPLGALDRSLRLEMGDEIRRIHRELGTTILYVTHDQEEALALADRVAIMNDGRIVAVDTPVDLYQRPSSAFAAAFFAGCNLVHVGPAQMIGERLARIRWLGSEVVVEVGGALREGPALLAIRPDSIRPGRKVGALSLRGEVRDVVFLGEQSRIVLQLPDGTRLVAHVSSSECSGLARGRPFDCFVERGDLALVSAAPEASLEAGP